MHHPTKHHFVSVTTVVIKDGKYLITKRSPNAKAFPSKWTVPGGKIETHDYERKEKDSSDAWYNIFEQVAAREVKEETGIDIKNIKYLTNLVFKRPDGIPTIVVSMFADYDKGDVILSDEMTEHKWVNLEEAKGHDFISGIYEELELLEHHFKGNPIKTWKEHNAPSSDPST